jgi:hypothetical protein
MTKPILVNDDPAPTTQRAAQDHRLGPIELELKLASAEAFKIHVALPISQVAAVR